MTPHALQRQLLGGPAKRKVSGASTRLFDLLSGSRATPCRRIPRALQFVRCEPGPLGGAGALQDDGSGPVLGEKTSEPCGPKSSRRAQVSGSPHSRSCSRGFRPNGPEGSISAEDGWVCHPLKSLTSSGWAVYSTVATSPARSLVSAFVENRVKLRTIRAHLFSDSGFTGSSRPLSVARIGDTSRSRNAGRRQQRDPCLPRHIELLRDFLVLCITEPPKRHVDLELTRRSRR